MRRILFILAVGASIAAPSFAADADHDLLLTVKSAIAAEPALRGVNVTVSVQDGVAVLWGQLPSDAVKDSLVKAVKGVAGISLVRADCWVPPPEDPLQAALRARMAPSVTVKPVASPNLPLLDPLTGTSAAYSPVPPPAPPAPAGPPQYPTISPPRVPVAPGQDVEAAVEAVRKSESRYSGLTLALNAGTVTISGAASDTADAWTLAASIRRVPGVDKVIVSKIFVR